MFFFQASRAQILKKAADFIYDSQKRTTILTSEVKTLNKHVENLLLKSKCYYFVVIEVFKFRFDEKILNVTLFPF